MSTEDTGSPPTPPSPPTPTSPSGRKRKRTVVLGSHPDLTSIGADDNAASRETTDHVTDNVPGADNKTQTTDSDTAVLGDDAVDSKNGDSESEQDAEKIADSIIEAVGEKHKYDTDTDSDVSVEPEVTDNDYRRKNTPRVSQPNDIVYDETKPRRLPNPKKLHLDIQEKPHQVFQDSINHLISPDEEESPSRRRRRQQQNQVLTNSKSEPSFKHTKQSPDPVRRETDTRPATSNGNIYQRSPDMSRRKLSHGSSPVKRLITKTSPVQTTPSTAHRMKRKISSDARIGIPQDRVQALRMPPRRKISSDARLGGYSYKEEQRTVSPLSVNRENITPYDVNEAVDTRKRKVSFDTTALVNGNRVMPLNDELHIPEVSEHVNSEQAEVTSYHGYYLPDHDGHEAVPKVYLTVENEDHTGSTTQLYFDDQNENEAAVFDNRAYIADDEQEDSQSSTPPIDEIRYSEHTDQYQTTSIQRYHDQPAVIPHTDFTHDHSAINVKRISTVSLPAGVGYRRQSLEDGQPKSILKTRREDGDSISQDSTVEKKFNVRKDSIALFTSKSGEIALQQIRAEHESQWKGFSGSRFKEVTHE